MWEKVLSLYYNTGRVGECPNCGKESVSITEIVLNSRISYDIKCSSCGACAHIDGTTTEKIKIICIMQVDKYQIIKFKEKPSCDFKKVKIGEQIFNPIPAMDTTNCIAIESKEDHSGIKVIEFIG